MEEQAPQSDLPVRCRVSNLSLKLRLQWEITSSAPIVFTVRCDMPLSPACWLQGFLFLYLILFYLFCKIMSSYTAHAIFKLLAILLPRLPECWGSRCVLPHLVIATDVETCQTAEVQAAILSDKSTDVYIVWSSCLWRSTRHMRRS